MPIRQRIIDDMKVAMKGGAEAKITEAEVNLRASKGLAYELSDAEAIQVLSSYAKQRREAIESFRQAARPDLAAREEAELRIIEEYLPPQLSADEIRRLGAARPPDHPRGGLTSAGGRRPRKSRCRTPRGEPGRPL